MGIRAWLVSILLVWPLGGCRRQAPPSAACFDLTAWKQFGVLFARNVEGPGSDFLMLHLTESNLDWENPDPSASTGGMIYRYVVADGELRPASPDDWKSALGPVRWGRKLPDMGTDLELNNKKYALFHRGKRVKLHGRTALKVAASPCGRLVVALSATGRPPITVIPFVGGGTAGGTHCVEFFRLPEMTRIGDPVSIWRGPNGEPMYMQWSPDGRYLLCDDEVVSKLCVVPVPEWQPQ